MRAENSQPQLYTAFHIIIHFKLSEAQIKIMNKQKKYSLLCSKHTHGSIKADITPICLSKLPISTRDYFFQSEIISHKITFNATKKKIVNHLFPRLSWINDNILFSSDKILP